MKILFIHQNYPAQFKQLAPALANRGHDVRALAINGEQTQGVKLVNYVLDRGSSKNIHPWALDFEAKLIRGRSAGRAMQQLKTEGFTPDLIIAHPGWGEALFARDVFPEAKQLHFLEFFYGPEGKDVNFDSEFAKDNFESKAKVRVKNASPLLNLQEMDRGYAPTEWQKSTWPPHYHDKIDVIFDGIDTEVVCPKKPNPLEIKHKDSSLVKRLINENDEVITFVNRNLEPYRGYHSFIRALPEIQKKRPNAITLIVGGDGVSYGAPAPEGTNWKNYFLEEVKDSLDLSRVVFLGKVSYDVYLNLLRLSSCHVYLTYPFVLSWSCLEAMSAGCIVVGSKTQPVEEVISHGTNGLLVDFFDYEAISAQVIDVLENQGKYHHLRVEARKHVIKHYDLETQCLPKQIKLVESMLKDSKVMA